MKKFVFSILLFFLAFNICHATNYEDRISLENYGVNKDIKIDNHNLNSILNTRLVDANSKVYDYAELLSDEEEEILRTMALEFYKETGFDMVIVTDSFYNYDDEDNYGYAQNFYDYNDFGLDDKYYSGVLILRNNYPDYPFYAIRTFGEAQLYFGGKRTEQVLDDTVKYIAGKRYFAAFNYVINEFDEYYEEGISSEYKKYKINKNGDLVAPYRFPFIIAPLIAIIVTYIFISVNVKKNKMIYKSTLANDYLDSNSIKYRVKNNEFLRSNTTRIPKNTSSGSGGFGGSGGFRGSSGRSSSGGGRRV
jgi:uncharacterized protein